MSASFELDAPDHFTAGAVGPVGERVFYLQGREGRTLVTLKVEKEQVRALAEYLASLLAKRPPRGEKAPGDLPLIEPVAAEWPVASLGVGYDEPRDRIVIVANELKEEESEDEAATARFAVTRAQAAAFVERARALMKAGRRICPMCSSPIDPGGHVCPRANGHFAKHE